MKLRGRSPLWLGIFVVALVYALSQGHTGSALNLLLRVT